MTIKYKFNKSSEARDCVVESVELKIKRNAEILSNEQALNIIYKDEYFADFEEDEWEELKSKKTIENTLNYLFYLGWDYSWILIEDYDLEYRSKEGYAFVNVGDYVCEFYIKTGYDYRKITNVNFIKYITESKTFTSPQQLKDYISTIEEPIEFIAESSIDDVLMKEWIGEWEYVEYVNDILSLPPVDGLDVNRVKSNTKEVTHKLSSPKLNSNWTFKIQ